jgi:signal transduction histidine kinase
MLSSLKARLIAGTVVGTLLIYAAAAIVMYGSIRQSLLAEFDAGLETKAVTLVGLTEQRERGLFIDIDPGQAEQFGQGRADAGYVLIGSDGRVFKRSDPLGQQMWWKAIPIETSGRRFGFLHHSGDVRGRYIALSFQPRPENIHFPIPAALRPNLTWIVLAPTADLDHKLQQLALLMTGTFALTTLISAGVLAAVIGRGLRPLGVLAGRLDAIGKENLFCRVDIGTPPDEMRPVVQRLNELLGRLEASFTRERAFTADVAHELRTPLAGLTTALEVSAARKREAAEYQQTIEQCLAASRSMRGLVENLLTLARADARQIGTQRQPVDLASLLRKTWIIFEPRAADRKIAVNWNLAADLTLHSDAGLLAMVISNLFDNAVSYANDGGEISVDLSRSGPDLVLNISNTGSEVSAEDADRAFERFWRGDAARNSAGGHFGLGLALCQRIVNLLGGTIAVRTEKQGVFAVVVRWAGGGEGVKVSSGLRA